MYRQIIQCSSTRGHPLSLLGLWLHPYPSPVVTLASDSCQYIVFSRPTYRPRLTALLHTPLDMSRINLTHRFGNACI